MLCAFFKQGQCTKGDKCKFSHDLTLERKCEKRSLYVDGRDEDGRDDLEKGESKRTFIGLNILYVIKYINTFEKGSFSKFSFGFWN